MFWKYPISKYVAPRADGLYVVRMQGRIKHVGIAFKNETKKNIKQQVIYHYRNDKSEVSFMTDSPSLTSIKYIKMDNYEKALEERERLYEKYKKHVRRYEV